MNVLVTGNRGFIGQNVCKHLITNNYNVTGIDLIDGKDIIDIQEQDLHDIDAVIHLAGSTSVWNTDNEAIIHNNISCFIHLLDLCKKLNIKFIYASSSCAVNITSLYGLSKQFDEQYSKMQKYGVGLRLHNVYGPGSRKDTLLGVCMNNNEVILYNKGQNRRHFTYIEDVAGVIEQVLNNDSLYNIYNVYNPKENSVQDFVHEVMKYKDIHVVITDKIRDKDKEIQFTDDKYINLLYQNYTDIAGGLQKMFLY